MKVPAKRTIHLHTNCKRHLWHQERVFGLPDAVGVKVSIDTSTTCTGSIQPHRPHKPGERTSAVEDAHGVTVTGRYAYASTVEKDGRLR